MLSGYAARRTVKLLADMSALRKWHTANRHNLFRHKLRGDFDRTRSEVRNLRRWHKLGII